MSADAGRESRKRALVRPYALTQGRTRPAVEMAMESLVCSTALAHQREMQLTHDWRNIAVLCQQVQSVAEVAAHVGVPLGVARVLVADMSQAGLVDIHEPAQIDDQVGAILLERVLSGLRKL